MPTIRSIYRPHSRQKPLAQLPVGIINGLFGSLVFWIVVGVIVAMFVGGWMDVGR